MDDAIMDTRWHHCLVVITLAMRVQLGLQEWQVKTRLDLVSLSKELYHNVNIPSCCCEQKFSGQNVYGILRAPRAASTEAVVMTAPYRPMDTMQDKTGGGIALMLGLAKAFRSESVYFYTCV